MQIPPKSAVAIRHVAFEDLGLLAGVLDARGWAVSYVHAATDDLRTADQADLLVVLGGPIGVYESDRYPFLKEEVALLKRRLAKGMPTLGICLGSQLMASALGARVYAGAVKEIGWGRVELTEAGINSCLRPLAQPEARVLHWHGDTFDLPEGATRLAGNQHYPNQAFSYGTEALALQFHIEANPLQLEEWYVGHTVELAANKVSIPELRSASHSVMTQARMTAVSIFENWLRRLA